MTGSRSSSVKRDTSIDLMTDPATLRLAVATTQITTLITFINRPAFEQTDRTEARFDWQGAVK